MSKFKKGDRVKITEVRGTDALYGLEVGMTAIIDNSDDGLNPNNVDAMYAVWVEGWDQGHNNVSPWDSGNYDRLDGWFLMENQLVFESEVA